MVTQEQIARKLGVSRQLVTFALAGYPKIAAASRDRILAAAREMGYRPNPHARALRRQRTGIIALWIPDQISTHYNHVAREMGRLVRQSKFELVVSEVGVADAPKFLSHVPVDAICAVDATLEVLRKLESAKTVPVPVVSIGATVSRKTDSVQVDLTAGATEVMKHLIGEGFGRIAHATFVNKDEDGTGRRAGYLQAVRRAGLRPEFIYYPLSEQQRPITRRVIQEYIRIHGRPEAIFCHSDDAALGMYRGLLDLGLKIPGDVALVGCDGIEDAEYLDCPLTTLVQPVAAMCKTAWQFLERRLDDAGAKIQRAVLKPTLTIRQSSLRLNLR